MACLIFLSLLIPALLWTSDLVQTLETLEFDFIDQVSTSGQCVLVLYELQTKDIEVIASRAVRPFFIIKNRKAEDSILQFQELVSVRKASCVAVFSESTSDVNRLQSLHRYTRYRSIFVFGAERSTNQMENHLLADTTYLHMIRPGRLLLTSHCDVSNSLRHHIWKRNATISRKSCSSTLRNKNVTVSAVFIPPYVILLPRHKPAGAEIAVMNMIAEKIGFHYDIKEEKTLFEKDRKTKTWFGAAGSIINGSSQFGIGTMPLIRPEDISSYPVDFSPQIGHLDNVLLSSKPKPLQPLGNFVRPFSYTVWICIFAIMVTCTLATLVLNYCERMKMLSFGKILLYFNGTLWGQNIKETLLSPYQSSFFVIFGVWMIGVFYIHAAYFCNLRACIVKKAFEDPIESEADAVRFQKDVYIPLGTGIVYQYQLAQSFDKRAIYARAVERKTLFSLVRSAMSVLDERRMIEEGGARVILRDRASMILIDVESRLGFQPFRVGQAVIDSTRLAIAMPMYQPWSEEFNSIAHQIVASGIVEHLMAKYTPVNKYSYSLKENADEELEPYKIEHVMGSLIILFVGLILAGLVMGVEVVIKSTYFNFPGHL